MTTKPPLSVWLFTASAWLLGGWLAYDGLHQRLFGDYVRIGGQLGPWAALATRVGIEPQSLGFVFLVLGLTLIASNLGLLLGHRWGFGFGLGASLLSLLYLGFGTPVALAALVGLLLPPTRDYLRARRAAPPSG